MWLKKIKRQLCLIKISIKSVFKNNWQYILCMSIVFAFGITIGIISALNSEIVDAVNPFYLLKSSEYSAFKYFIIYVFMSALVCFILWLNNINKLFMILSILSIFFCGYKFGFNCIESIQASVMTGIFSILFFYIPIFFSMFGCACVMLKYSSTNWISCKCNQTCPNILRSAAKFCLINLAVLSSIIFIITIILPSILKLILY